MVLLCVTLFSMDVDLKATQASFAVLYPVCRADFDELGGFACFAELGLAQGVAFFEAAGVGLFVETWCHTWYAGKDGSFGGMGGVGGHEGAGVGV